MTTEKIMIGIDDQVIELTGKEKEEFLADRKATADAEALRQANELSKAQAKAIAEGKLVALGLTIDDLRALGL
jgi:hypothetical protein